MPSETHLVGYENPSFKFQALPHPAVLPHPLRKRTMRRRQLIPASTFADSHSPPFLSGATEAVAAADALGLEEALAAGKFHMGEQRGDYTQSSKPSNGENFACFLTIKCKHCYTLRLRKVSP